MQPWNQMQGALCERKNLEKSSLRNIPMCWASEAKNWILNGRGGGAQGPYIEKDLTHMPG